MGNYMGSCGTWHRGKWEGFERLAKFCKKSLNFSENLLQLKKFYVTLNNAFVRGQCYKKEVNMGNEGRNPSQLSADYNYLRLR